MHSHVVHPFDRWLNETRERRSTHPALKRMVLEATRSALRKELPDQYFNKCHGVTLALFMILRTLRIRANIHGGSVSWQFGGLDAAGHSWQKRCGFWTPRPGLPSPHVWLVTEYGELVDLSCSFFSLSYHLDHPGNRSLDTIPMIWAPIEQMSSLPTLQYTAMLSFGEVDLQSCDELAQRTVATALSELWGSGAWRETASTARFEVQASAACSDHPLIEGRATIGSLRRENTWVARNSAVSLCAPPSASIAAPGIVLHSR